MLNISLLWTFYLAITHMIGDSFIPLNLWNKYYRNALKRKSLSKGEPPFFVQAVEDQIIHILLLIPLAI